MTLFDATVAEEATEKVDDLFQIEGRTSDLEATRNMVFYVLGTELDMKDRMTRRRNFMTIQSHQVTFEQETSPHHTGGSHSGRAGGSRHRRHTLTSAALLVSPCTSTSGGMWVSVRRGIE